MRTTLTLNIKSSRAILPATVVLVLAGLAFAFAPIQSVAAARQALIARLKGGTVVVKKAASAAPVAALATVKRSAPGAVIMVTTTNQEVNTDGNCSLQEAIFAANLDANQAIDQGSLNGPRILTGCTAGSGADTIVLPANAVFLLSTITQDQFSAAGLSVNPSVVSTITIQGNGSRLELTGALNLRAFVVDYGPGEVSIFPNDPQVGVGRLGNLTLQNLHIKGFKAKGGNGADGGGGGLGAGGAIYVRDSGVGPDNAMLTVENCTFENNTATGGNGGADAATAGGGGGGGIGGNGEAQGPGNFSGGGGGGGSRGMGGKGVLSGGGGGGTAFDGVTGGATVGGIGGFNCGGRGGRYAGSANPPGFNGANGFCTGGGGAGGAAGPSQPFAGTPAGPDDMPPADPPCNDPTCVSTKGGNGGNGNYGGGGGGGGALISGNGDGGNGGNGGLGGGGGAGGTRIGEASNGTGGNGGFGGGGGAGAGGAANGTGGNFGGNAGSGAGGGGGGLGAAIFNDSGIVIIRNSTFFGNSVAGGSGATLGVASGTVFSRNGSLTVLNSTFSNNSGFASDIQVIGDGAAVNFVLRNTILANHSSGGTNCLVSSANGGSAVSGGVGNLIESNGVGTTACPGLLTSVDPNLGVLQINAPGNTPTMAITNTSPAFNTADSDECLAKDQRGVLRPQFTACDIGAYELKANLLADLGVSKTATAVVDPDGAGPLAPVNLPCTVGPPGPPCTPPNVPPGSVNAGGYIRYDVPFGNAGPDDADNVRLTDVIPGNTAFVGALATGGVFVPAMQPPVIPFMFFIAASKAASPDVSLTCTVAGAPGSQQITCTVGGINGSLPAGYAGTLTFFVKVNESVGGGTIVANGANITSAPSGSVPSTPDPNPGNNTSLPTSTVVVASSTLTISKTVQSAVTTFSNSGQSGGPFGPPSVSGGSATTSFGSFIALVPPNTLSSFSPSTPGTVIVNTALTGLVAGDAIVAIDTRPATGVLFGLGVNGAVGRLYSINLITGVATQVSPGFAFAVTAGASFGFDFNPTVDRIRVTSSTGDNFRLNPDTGAVAGTDTALSFGAVVVGAAYDRNFASATQTTLFGIESTADTLVRIGGVNGSPSPNGGVVSGIGPLGVNTSAAVGFDIVNDAAGTAFALLTVGGVPGLYSINLTTGAATLVGALPVGATDIAAVPVGIIPGTELTYRVTVTNTGPSDVTNVRFTDKLPSGLETPPGRVLGARYVAVNQVSGAVFTCAPPTGVPVTNNPQGNGGQVICTAPLLSATFPNNTAVFDVVVFIDPATKAPLTNVAGVDATINNFNIPVSATTTLITPVVPTSDLALTKSLTNAAGIVNGPVTAGTTFTYTVTLTNNGQSTAQMARLVDTFPAFQRVTNIAISQTPDGNGAPAFACTATPAVGALGNTTSVVCSAAELPPNRRADNTVNPSGTVTFTFTVVQDQLTPQPLPVVYQNCVTATSMSFDPNTANSINVCLSATIDFLAPVLATKVDTPDPVIAGNLLTYVIAGNTPGPSAALNFRIIDPLPAGTVFISAVASPGATLTTPSVGANGVVTAQWDAAGGTDSIPGGVVDGLTPVGTVRTLTIVVRVCPDFQQILNLTDAQMCVPNLTNTATVTSDTPGTPATPMSVTTVQAQSDLSISKSDSPDPAVFSTTGSPSNVTYTLSFLNAGPSNANGVTITDVLPKGFTVVGTPTSTVPGTTFVITTIDGVTTVVASLGVLGAANQCQLTRPTSGTIVIVARVPIKHPTITVTNTATIASTNCLAETGSLAVQSNPLSGNPAIIVPGTGMLANNRAFADTRIVPPGSLPGVPYPALAEASDQKEGSILFYPIYTSDAVNANSQNTRVNITNTSSTEQVCVHLFAVDGASCSVLDMFVCLTANQTASFLASDLDPGSTGYMMALTVDCNTGLPRAYNCLIGDEYVKFSSGHQANLGAVSVASSMILPSGTDSNATTALLKFDGISYNRLPRVLASDTVQSAADGNSTLMIIDRIGGNMATSGATIGNITGLLFDDAETGFSFTANLGLCQYRTVLGNGFPRSLTPFTRVIPAGRTGWMKFWRFEDGALIGSQINFNPNSNASAGAFNQGHNLHALTLTDKAEITVPVYIPSC